MNIAVIGAGKWGQALAHAFSEKNDVVITSRHRRPIPRFVSLEDALSREYLVLAISAQHVREWMERSFVDREQKILVASKGIEVASGELLNQVLEHFVPAERLAFLSGPSFAAEVMRSLPTALVVSSADTDLAGQWAGALPRFIRGYVDDDVIGAEVGGAYKNVIAIAGGVCDGLELGNNARAAMISRGLVEMARFGMRLGAREATFLSLGGAGDLFLTASSRLSRNYRVGLGLARGETIDAILAEIGEVAEGVGTAEAIHRIAEREGIYLPIAEEVYRMIAEGKAPRRSVIDLLER
ncbi:NAD(P)H-dependent glycerol-3-phosphate dehydrogenase [Nitratifractor sp.]